jgi:DNA-binding PadR family transcriptional regulator
MHHTRKAARRGRRGRHMRGFDPARGPRGHRGHRARRGDVRSAILALLEERPMHGYEMIQQLEERSGGRWRPSAGSIYPTLQLLEDEGLVSGEEVDGRRVLSLTEAGHKAAKERTERSPWETEGEDSPYHQLRREGFGLVNAARQVAQVGSSKQAAEVAKILADARRRIYAILAEG